MLQERLSSFYADCVVVATDLCSIPSRICGVSSHIQRRDSMIEILQITATCVVPVAMSMNSLQALKAYRIVCLHFLGLASHLARV